MKHIDKGLKLNASLNLLKLLSPYLILFRLLIFCCLSAEAYIKRHGRAENFAWLSNNIFTFRQGKMYHYYSVAYVYE